VFQASDLPLSVLLIIVSDKPVIAAKTKKFRSSASSDQSIASQRQASNCKNPFENLPIKQFAFDALSRSSDPKLETNVTNEFFIVNT
jgi:hypothetical protein